MAQYLLTHEWALGLLMSAIVAALIGLIVGYSRLVERLASRRPKSAPPKAETHPASRVVSRAIGEAPAPSTIEAIGNFIMSRVFGAAGDVETINVEQRSYAVEQPRERPGTEAGNDVPGLADQLGTLDDDQLLDILAELRDEAGEYRFAESRVAKFIGGRVEDRLAQVRAVRGTEPPVPSGRVLRVRDEAGERVIPFREGK